MNTPLEPANPINWKRVIIGGVISAMLVGLFTALGGGNWLPGLVSWFVIGGVIAHFIEENKVAISAGVFVYGLNFLSGFFPFPHVLFYFFMPFVFLALVLAFFRSNKERARKFSVAAGIVSILLIILALTPFGGILVYMLACIIAGPNCS